MPNAEDSGGNGRSEGQLGSVRAGTGGRTATRTVALSDLEELDDDLGGRADQDLALAGLLGVVDAVEGIVEDRSANHLDWILRGRRFSNRVLEEMRYLPQKSSC